MRTFAKVFFPSLLVIGFGLTLFAIDIYGQSNTWPDFRGNMMGVSMPASGAMPTGMIYCEPPVTDTAPMICYFQGADAWSQATGANQTGGNIEACAGLGTRQITIDNFANCGGDNVATIINGVAAVTFTEGAQWNAGASNNDACLSLAAAMNSAYGAYGFNATCPGGGAVIYLDLPVLWCDYRMTESDATCTTLTHGTDGNTEIGNLRATDSVSPTAPYMGFRDYNHGLRATASYMGFQFNGSNVCYINVSGIICQNPSTGFYADDTGAFIISSVTRIQGDSTPTDGNVIISNTAGNNFGLLMFGGQTNAYPALKRAGTGLELRRADDSAYTDLTVNALALTYNRQLYLDGGGDTYLISNAADVTVHMVGGQSALTLKEGEFAAGETTQLWDPCTFANLGAATDGTFCYCSDCTKATPCAGAGNGALAKRLNGAWDCD